MLQRYDEHSTPKYKKLRKIFVNCSFAGVDAEAARRCIIQSLHTSRLQHLEARVAGGRIKLTLWITHLQVVPQCKPMFETQSPQWEK